MGKTLDCLGRRDLLSDRKADPERLRRLGREMAQAGFLSDALDFFAAAGDRDGLEELERTALDEGDLFILGRIRKELGRDMDPETLRQAAHRAQDLGKAAFARRARSLADPEPPSPEGSDA